MIARARLLALTALASLLVVAPATAGAATKLTRTLRDKATGFSVRVPSGYKLSADGGRYTISGRAGTVVFSRATTTEDPATAGREIIKAAGGTPANESTSGGYRASYTVGGVARRLQVRTSGSGLALATFSGVKAKARATAVAAVSGLNLLERIVGTAKGGKAIVPPAPLPLKPFTTADNGASAQVLDVPGWVYGGQDGVVEGLNPASGIFAFGLNFPVASTRSSLAGYPGVVVADFKDPATSFAEVLPKFLATLGNPIKLDNFTVTGTFDGAQQLLSPPFQSGFYTFTTSSQGHPLTGVALFGGAPDPRFNDGSWLAYTSYVIVDAQGDPRVGAGLLASWASWNPSNNQDQRRAQTLNTILTTNVGSGGIDPAVFDAAAQRWDAYIRGDGTR